MPLGYLSSRTKKSGRLHHIWNNNGTWWAHYTLHFGHRKRRIRRSLRTRSLDEAIRRRDELLARIARDGEWIEDRSDKREQAGEARPGLTWRSVKHSMFLYSNAWGAAT